MRRIGAVLSFKPPCKILIDIPGTEKQAEFPINTETSDVIGSYLTTYSKCTLEAISRAETPKMDFGGRGKELDPSSC